MDGWLLGDSLICKAAVINGSIYVMDGYIPTSDDKERRREWEDTIKETLMDTSKNGFGLAGRKQIM